jgi:putative component of membrane protein insertase Oxa1/YidC/SpoIIIJ protein YidD
MVTTVNALVWLMAFLALPLLHGEEPWGKDASLAKITAPKRVGLSSSPSLYLIYFHQQVLSEADGPRSHYVPSSSEYARQAIVLWGTGMGFVLGCDRLLRENNDPWLYRTRQLRSGNFKSDPVPRPPARAVSGHG